MKVMKFGGGCLKNPEDFLKVAGIVNSEKEKVIVVVSAVYGITDLLSEGIQKSLQSEKNVPEIMERLRDRHFNLAKHCVRNEGSRKKILEEIEARMNRLERLLHGISYTGEITNSLRALILSFGERLGAILLSGVLEDGGMKSCFLDADEMGMVTDDYFEYATANLPKIKENLKKTLLPLVEAGTIPVITGYFGCTEEKKVTTFGRNGSDYSAAVVAYATESNALEIWKDVDGFMSADPKIVEEARVIDRLSYDEVAELSYFGAKILHPRTVEPLAGMGIPLYIKNINNSKESGTEVLSSGCLKEEVIKSVTYNDDIAVLRIRGSGVGYRPGIIAEVGRTLSENGINIYSVITSQTCINLLIDKSDSKKSLQTVSRLKGSVIENIVLEEDIALVAVVGEGLLKTKGVAARVFSAVARENINVEMISSGASEVAYYFVIKEQDLKKAINAIHTEFFSQGKIF